MNWTSKTIVWQEEYPDGTKYALLEGDKTQADVSFTYAFFMPSGFWDAPHFHSADATITVISGEICLGYGDKIDRSQSKCYGAGSVLQVPAYSTHYDGAEADTLIIGTAIGQWKTTYVPAGESNYSRLD